MRQQPGKRLTVVGILAAVLAMPQAAAEDAATVVVGQPRPTAPRTVELPGSFEPYEAALLHAKVTGYVSRVHVDIGQHVAKGTALVQLDIPEMKPALRRAAADVLAAEAVLEKAEAQIRRDRVTHGRLAELQAREPLAVTQQDVDMAAAGLQVSEAAARSASAEISVAQARLEELEAQMAYAVIRAPFDGAVVRRFVDPGALVVSGADGGKPVLEVAREDRLRLVLAVPEWIVPQIRTGVRARITVDALPGRTFEAAVSRYAGALSQDTRTMRTELDLDNPEGILRPGMYASVRLELGGSPGELSVPASVIRHDDEGQSFLWTVHDGTAARTPVEIVRDDGALAVISAGLPPEAAIVLEGAAQLHEGQPVSIVAATEELP